MQHEIRKSGGPACPTCGAYELIHVGPHHLALTQKLSDHLNADAPWWRPFKRRWSRHVAADMQAGVQDFADQTRHDIV